MFRVKVDGYEVEVLYVDIVNINAKFLIWDDRNNEFKVVNSACCEYVKDIMH